MLRTRLAQIERFVIGLSCVLIHGYQRCLSPLLGQRCRFWPSCSCYAEQALRQHGLWRGSWFVLRRLSRCHPWHPGGIDPIP